jgi:hypothetical protein
MSRDPVPNLATDWKARLGASVLALAIGLTVALLTGNLDPLLRSDPDRISTSLVERQLTDAGNSCWRAEHI